MVYDFAVCLDDSFHFCGKFYISVSYNHCDSHALLYDEHPS